MRKRLNIIGEQYEFLKVIEELEQRGTKRRFLCKCNCGNLTIALMDSLRSGNTKSCGCLRLEKLSSNRPKHKGEDLSNRQFERLFVLCRSDKKYRNGAAYWLCRCECGEIIEVLGSDLRSGNTKSCGCMKNKHLLEYSNRKEYLRAYQQKVQKLKPRKKYPLTEAKKAYHRAYYLNVTKPKRAAQKETPRQ